MIDSLRVVLPQGVELTTAFVEIQGYSWTKIKAEKTTGGANRIDGRLVEVEESTLDNAQTQIKEIEFNYAIWATRNAKHQSKPHFGEQKAILKLADNPSIAEKFNNFAEHATDLQKFEQIGDLFLQEYLTSNNQ